MKRLFYISISGITTFHWVKGQFVEYFQFNPDQQGQSDFIDYITQYPTITSYALVDIIEEEFLNLIIPRMSRKNREAYIDRKMQAKFRGLDYRFAIYQGHSTQTENQDEVLLTALTKPDMLKLLLAWVQHHKVPLQGIYSAPLVSTKILKQLNINDNYSLLVNELSSGHIRQTFFHQHNLKSSRLSKLNIQDDDDFASAIIEEVQKNQRYLNRFHLLPKDELLKVNIICGSERYDALMQNLKNTKNWQFNLLHIDVLVDAFKLKTPVKPNQTELLFAHLVATYRFKENLASHHDRRFFSSQSANKSMLAASVMLGIATLLYSGQLLLKMEGLESQTNLTRQHADFLIRQYSKMQSALPHTDYTARAMHQAVILNGTLNKTKFNVSNLYQLISQHLSQFPAITLQELSWQSSFDNPDNKNKKAITDKTEKNQDDPNADDSVQVESGQTIYRTVILKARLNNFTGDYISAFDTVNRFVNSLKTNKQVYLVEIIKLPIDINSKTVSSGSSGTQIKNIKTGFSVKLIFRSHMNEI